MNINPDTLEMIFNFIELITGPLLIFTIIYSIISFLMPFCILIINSKIDKLDDKIKELSIEHDKLAELVILATKNIDVKIAPESADDITTD